MHLSFDIPSVIFITYFFDLRHLLKTCCKNFFFRIQNISDFDSVVWDLVPQKYVYLVPQKCSFLLSVPWACAFGSIKFSLLSLSCCRSESSIAVLQQKLKWNK
jgi:hypothetical protein